MRIEKYYKLTTKERASRKMWDCDSAGNGSALHLRKKASTNLHFDCFKFVNTDRITVLVELVFTFLLQQLFS